MNKISYSNQSSNLSIEDIYREPPARDPEDRSVIEKAREALSVQSGAGHQHLQVRSEPGNVLNQTKQDVCVERSLVGLVYDDHTAGRERKAAWVKRYHFTDYTITAEDAAQVKLGRYFNHFFSTARTLYRLTGQ